MKTDRANLEHTYKLIDSQEEPGPQSGSLSVATSNISNMTEAGPVSCGFFLPSMASLNWEDRGREGRRVKGFSRTSEGVMK